MKQSSNFKQLEGAACSVACSLAAQLVQHVLQHAPASNSTQQAVSCLGLLSRLHCHKKQTGPLTATRHLPACTCLPLSYLATTCHMPSLPRCSHCRHQRQHINLSPPVCVLPLTAPACLPAHSCPCFLCQHRSPVQSFRAALTASISKSTFTVGKVFLMDNISLSMRVVAETVTAGRASSVFSFLSSPGLCVLSLTHLPYRLRAPAASTSCYPQTRHTCMQSFCAALTYGIRNSTFTVGELFLVDNISLSMGVVADFVKAGGASSAFSFPMAIALEKVLRVSEGLCA